MNACNLFTELRLRLLVSKNVTVLLTERVDGRIAIQGKLLELNKVSVLLFENGMPAGRKYRIPLHSIIRIVENE